MLPAVRCTAEILLGLLGLVSCGAEERREGAIERPRLSTQTAQRRVLDPPGYGRRPLTRLSFLLGVLVLSASCASEMVLRAEPDRLPSSRSALASIDPVAVRLSVEAAGFGSDSTVGSRAAGLGQPEGAIYLTEGPGDVLRQLVAGELRAAGHKLVDEDPQVEVTVHVLEFEVQMGPRSLLWDVRAEIRMALELVGEQGSTTTTGKFIYTVERRGSSVLWPAIGTAGRILAECLADLAELVAERDAFGEALAKAASPGP